MPRRPQDPQLLAKFGARLRAVREAGGVTQQRLADALGVRAGTVSEIEAGALSPTLTTIAALARALGVRPSALLDFDAKPEAHPVEAEEAEMLRVWRGLGDEPRELLLGMARLLAGRGRC